MIKDYEKEIIRQTWKRAASDFEIEIITPYHIEVFGQRTEIFAFVPNIGSRKGTIVELVCSPDYSINKNIVEWANRSSYHYSFVNKDDFIEYSRSTFEELFEDWRLE
jgi:hypothetical protein